MEVGRDPSPFFLLKNDESFDFFDFDPNKSFWIPTLWRCMGQSGKGADAVYALFSNLCYVGGFGDRGDLVVPTRRGASGDVVTTCAYLIEKEFFLVSRAVPRAGQCPCQRREMTICTNNGLHE